MLVAKHAIATPRLCSLQRGHRGTAVSRLGQDKSIAVAFACPQTVALVVAGAIRIPRWAFAPKLHDHLLACTLAAAALVMRGLCALLLLAFQKNCTPTMRAQSLRVAWVAHLCAGLKKEDRSRLGSSTAP